MVLWRPPPPPPPRNFLLFFVTLIDGLCKFHIFIMISVEKRMWFYHEETAMNKLHIESTILDLKFIKENLKDFNKAALLSRGYTSNFLLVQVMRFFQILSRRQRERVATRVTNSNNFGDKLKAAWFAYFKRPEARFSKVLVTYQAW